MRYTDPVKMLKDIQAEKALGTKLFKADIPEELLLGIESDDGRRWDIRISKLRCVSGAALINISKQLPAER